MTGAAAAGARGALEREFRDERAAVLATLIRHVGDFDLAEEAVQDAFTDGDHGVGARRRAGSPRSVAHGGRPPTRDRPPSPRARP
jgi:hypothetical protein